MNTNIPAGPRLPPVRQVNDTGVNIAIAALTVASSAIGFVLWALLR